MGLGACVGGHASAVVAGKCARTVSVASADFAGGAKPAGGAFPRTEEAPWQGSTKWKTHGAVSLGLSAGCGKGALETGGGQALSQFSFEAVLGMIPPVIYADTRGKY